MDLTDLTLIISDKADPEREAVAKVWEQQGGNILRLGRFWDPPQLDIAQVRVYGSDTFGLVLAQIMGLRLLEPKQDLLCEIPAELLKRHVTCVTLDEAIKFPFPQFIKSAAPKIFRAAVYESATELNCECKDLDGSTPVLVANMVAVEAEARCFVLDGCILDCAVFEGEIDTASATAFSEQALKVLTLPRACVMDVGYLSGLGWAVIEFNAAWGAGLNGCDANKVYPVIEAATTVFN